jgi:GNAT superfamily N-acetyltransferase
VVFLMHELVRPAALSDAAEIAALESVSRGHLLEQRGGPEWLASQPAWNELDVARRAASPQWHLVLAEIDDVPVGFAAGQLADGICTVERLYVDPEAREVGLGEYLLEAMTVWARAIGATAIESVALPGDRQTKNLFERFGMKARLLIVSRSLIGDGDSEDAS